MPVVQARKGAMSLNAFRGDRKTLLAFNLDDGAEKNLAGFTIQVQPPGVPAYYLMNNLRFQSPGQHAQDAGESPFSSVNAPIHKFRWLHVPGSAHQGTQPVLGSYTYTVTPRYFANGALQPLDAGTSVSVTVAVDGLQKENLQLGFTRGFTQSQAFVRHFGKTALISPRNRELIFDTTQVSGKNDAGEEYTFADEYEWLGFTARERIFAILQEVAGDPSLRLDVFAYDLNEPDVVKQLLDIGASSRVRVILDNAALHHSTAKPTMEDLFQTQFAAKAGAAQIQRRKFGRYAHDKVLIVYDGQGARTVLTGSTNFSVTGLYVNSNHVLVFDDRNVAGAYAQAFEQTWNSPKDSASAFAASDVAMNAHTFDTGVPSTTITFSPHTPAVAAELLKGIVTRIGQEANATNPVGSVLFAVMEMDVKGSQNPVYTALNALHAEQSIFSYGISDDPEGISLYPVGSRTGVLVTGKPAKTVLPPPFKQVPGVGLGHQVHHKFVVCGFRGADPVVYCGSSNLALKGEQVNGDNLLAIRDEDVVTAFAIEALARWTTSTFWTGSPTRRTPRPPPPMPPRPRPSRRRPRARAGTCRRPTAGPPSTTTPATSTRWTASSSAGEQTEKASRGGRGGKERGRGGLMCRLRVLSSFLRVLRVLRATSSSIAAH